MKRGEIYYANLNPTIGSEINKKRPVLIISNNANNKASSTVTVLPLTSQIQKVYPFEVFLRPEDSGLTKASKVQCQQIRTLSKLRFSNGAKPIGVVKKLTLQHIDVAIKLHLDLQ